MRPLVALCSVVLGGLSLFVSAPSIAARPARLRAAKPPKIRLTSEKEIQARLALRTGMATREERMAAALAAGPRNITGAATLSGVLFASDLTIAAGSSVVIRGGATIVVAGDLIVEAPLTGELTPEIPGAKPDYGPDQETILDIDDHIYFSGSFRGADGRAGKPYSGATSGAGGDGGPGQGLSILCSTLELRGDVGPGRGGDGGDCEVRAGGTSTSSLTARGGAGGPAGSLNITALNKIIHNGGRLLLRRGGAGGAATCAGADGAPGDGCGASGARAPSGEAVGGNGGAGTASVIDAKLIVDLDDDIIGDVSRSLAIAPEDTFQPPTGDEVGDALRQRVLASIGGDAGAVGGRGGDAGACLVDADLCPTKALRAGRGGPGGAATARGGDGGSFPAVAVRAGAFLADLIVGFRFDVHHAPAGSAIAEGGDGGKGADGTRARKPAAGGRAGLGGSATASPGRPGAYPRVGLPSLRFGPFGPDDVLFQGRDLFADDEFEPTEELHADEYPVLLAALNGRAEATSGNGGGGGKGGDCCDKPGGKGAAGGAGGPAGVARVLFDPDVRPLVRAGTYEATPGIAGTAGARGADCLPRDDPGAGGDGTAEDPFHPPRLLGSCVDFLESDRPGEVGFDFYLPGSIDGLANPPRNTKLLLRSTLFAEGVNFDVEIRVNGTRVKNQFVPDSGRVTPLADVFVLTPLLGDLCVTVLIDGRVIQMLKLVTSAP